MTTHEDGLESIARRLALAKLEDKELLQAFAAILEELRARGIARTSNNPVADYTEWLVCKRLNLDPQPNSNAGFDGLAEDGTRCEIKARRVTRHNSSVQLSALRNLADAHFDYLVGVIYEADFSIRYAAKIPHFLVEPNARFSPHSNAHTLNLTPKILELPGVEEITGMLAR